MRGGDHVVELEQRVVLVDGLGVPDVDAGAGDLVVLERVVEGLLVDDAASAGGDQISRRLHHCQLFGADDASGFGTEGRVNGDVVGLHDLFERGEADAGGLGHGGVLVGVVGDDVESEGLGADGGLLGDVSEGDESEGLAVERAGGSERDALAGAGGVVVGDQLAVEGEEQRDGVRGDLVDAVVGDVADDDVVVDGGLPVDVVEADAVADDDLEVGGGVEDVLADLPVAADDAVGVGDVGGDVFLLLEGERDQVGVGFGQFCGLCGVRLALGSRVDVVDLELRHR